MRDTATGDLCVADFSEFSASIGALIYFSLNFVFLFFYVVAVIVIWVTKNSDIFSVGVFHTGLSDIYKISIEYYNIVTGGICVELTHTPLALGPSAVQVWFQSHVT